MKIAVYLDKNFWADELAKDVEAGLSSKPYELSPKWLYDEKGSELFEQIMVLEEYYQTRTEKEILTEHADAIAQITQANTLVELGSGNSEKTLILLQAMAKDGHCERFVPFDASETAVQSSVAAATELFSGLEINGIVADFEHHLKDIPHTGKRLVVFLGGTIGNLRPNERKNFLTDIAVMMDPGDYFLLGTDLVKDSEILCKAYDDSLGVTADFNLNILNVLNRELGADFDLSQFSHVAVYNDEMDWIEMRLRSLTSQKIFISKLDMYVELEQGEEILTEISAKFKPEGIKEEIETAGLEIVSQWTDKAGDYLLNLAVAP